MLHQVLANFGVLLALLSGHIVQRIFFGALRPNEVEVSQIENVVHHNYLIHLTASL